MSFLGKQIVINRNRNIGRNRTETAVEPKILNRKSDLKSESKPNRGTNNNCEMTVEIIYVNKFLFYAKCPINHKQEIFLQMS